MRVFQKLRVRSRTQVEAHVARGTSGGSRVCPRTGAPPKIVGTPHSPPPSTRRSTGEIGEPQSRTLRTERRSGSRRVLRREAEDLGSSCVNGSSAVDPVAGTQRPWPTGTPMALPHGVPVSAPRGEHTPRLSNPSSHRTAGGAGPKCGDAGAQGCEHQQQRDREVAAESVHDPAATARSPLSAWSLPSERSNQCLMRHGLRVACNGNLGSWRLQ